MIRGYFLTLVCLIFLIATKNIVAQPQPVLSCVSVVNASSIEVSWNIPSGSFDGFRLFYGPAGAPLNYFTDFPNSASSAIINVPDVTTNKYEFVLRTFINSPSSLSLESNHLQSILLEVDGDGTGIGSLEWNHQGGNELDYRILRSFDNINYELLNNSTLLEYHDTISGFCNPLTFYYIIEHGACGAKSNIVSVILRDLTIPHDPVLKVVSIEGGFAELTWEPSPSLDVDSIIIERYDGGWFEYRITGNTTSFIDNFTSDPDYRNPCDQSIQYIVRAKDQCGLESSGAVNYRNPHHTLLLTGNMEEQCDRKATLYWNQYDNMVPPVSSYKVERSTGGSGFVSVADVPASGSAFSFIEEELLPAGEEIIYRVVAVNSDNSLSSKSCEISLTPNPLEVDEFNIDFVTVTNNTYITLNVTSLPGNIPVSADIFRSGANGMELLTTVPWNTSGSISFTDMNVDVNQLSYLYQVNALDDCGFVISESQEFNSLLLEIGVSNETDISLYWNNHIGWDSELKEYLVYKYNDGVLVSGFPRTVDASLTGYDEVDESKALKTTYRIEAVKFDGSTVSSNEVLLPRTAKIDIPTAFRPKGVNSEFKPIITNVDSDAYIMTIYNKWGQLVFTTNNPLEGWDGSFNGNIQQGVFIYMISYKDQTGNEGFKRGSVILLN